MSSKPPLYEVVSFTNEHLWKACADPTHGRSVAACRRNTLLDVVHRHLGYLG